MQYKPWLTMIPQGLVTATQKLNRKVIREAFKKDIDECLKSTA